MTHTQDSAALLALAKRVEAIVGDGVVAMRDAWLAIHGPEPASGYAPRCKPSFCPKWEAYIQARCRFMNLLDMGAFLEAATLLVPEGHRFEVTTTGFKPGAIVCGNLLFGPHEGAHAATPALALTAACLRAHAALAHPKEQSS